MAQAIATLEEEPRVSSTAAEPVNVARAPQSSSTPRATRIPRWAFALAASVAMVAIFAWWLHARNFESTDDAQIDGHLNAISARVSGTVLYINPKAEDN